MRDTDRLGIGLLIGGLLLLVFFVPIAVIVGGSLGYLWQFATENVIAITAAAVAITAIWIYRRRRPQRDEDLPERVGRAAAVWLHRRRHPDGG